MGVILYDTYTDTEGLDLSLHVSDSGHSYTKHPSFTDGLTIQSNRAGKDANTGTTVYYASAIPTTMDCRIEGVIVDVGNVNRATGIGMRINTSADHGIYARRQTATAWQLLTIVSGVAVQNFETIATTFSAGLSTRLSAWTNDDKVWWAVDGVVSPLSPHTITSVELLTIGRIGIRCSNNQLGTGFQVDSLLAETLVRRAYSPSLRPAIFKPGRAR